MSDNWTPPRNPDPIKILHEATRDSQVGDEEIALQKFLWFHQHALRHEPSLSALRLSFALGYWADLSDRYPPARDAMERVFQDTEEAFHHSRTVERFQELVALNHYLGNDRRTVDLIRTLFTGDRELAEACYPSAEEALISAKEYRLCDPFLNVDQRIADAAANYIGMRDFESRSEDRSTPQTARNSYIHNTCTLVALLVINGRLAEAEDAHDKSLLILDDEPYRKVLDQALAGSLPNLPSMT